MIDFIKKLLESENIDTYVFRPLNKCLIKKKYLLEKAGIEDGFAVIFAIPYYTRACIGKRNISAYATSRDYHLYVKELRERTLPLWKEKFPGVNFELFADHSPIDERHAAVNSGLGVLGKNRLIITEKYSSYIFIGELIVGAPLPDGYFNEIGAQSCEECGLCQKSCPWLNGECDECLSAITQKKGELSEDEAALITKYGLWGCDICSEVCPHTKKALKSGSIFSPINFFNTLEMPYLTYENVEQMSEEEFLQRAFSWRGRETILRNIRIGGSNDDKKEAEKTEKGDKKA